MAEGILGLGTGQAASLNQDLIDRLKAAEKRARVEPLEKQIEDITTERESFKTINDKVAEVLEAIKPFDLFVSGGLTAFDQKSANTNGTSVTFEATDISKLNKGITSVDIKTLAQKDVYQSNAINAASKDALGDIGVLSIEVGGEKHDFNTADYANYQELSDAINAKTGIYASVDQVGDDSFRLIIKSEETGSSNALKISGSASQALGYTTDGTTVNSANQTLKAQNLTAEVDGVSYSVSSNVLNVNGLKMTAASTGVSSININDDKSQISTQIQNFITKYNELVDLVEAELGNNDSKISDKSALRDVLSQIKTQLFGQYGKNEDKSIFNYGFEIDKAGKLSLDTAKFNTAIEQDFTGLKDLFIGSAEKEGLGTKLKSVFDEMNFSGGLLNTFSGGIDSREETLKKEKENAQKALDDKYSQLAQRFASYSAIITGFEASFAGLKSIIQQANSGS